MTQTKIVTNSDVKYSEDVETQVVKLIKSYYFKHKVFEQEIELDEFVSITYDLFLRKGFIQKFNSNRANLSTYVYYVIGKYFYCIYFQAKYNISYSLAMTLQRHRRNEQLTKHILSLQHSYVSLNQEVYESEKNSETYESIIPNEEESEIDKYIEDQYSEDSVKEMMCILNTTTALTERQKYIIQQFIQNNCSYVKTAQVVKCSRQRIHQIIEKFRRVIIKNKKGTC